MPFADKAFKLLKAAESQGGIKMSKSWGNLARARLDNTGASQQAQQGAAKTIEWFQGGPPVPDNAFSFVVGQWESAGHARSARSSAHALALTPEGPRERHRRRSSLSEAAALATGVARSVGGRSLAGSLTESSESGGCDEPVPRGVQYLMMPQLAPGVKSGRVTTWLVRPGDPVRPRSAVAVIETSTWAPTADRASGDGAERPKAALVPTTVLLEVQCECVMALALAAEGVELSVGTPIAAVVLEGTEWTGYGGETGPTAVSNATEGAAALRVCGHCCPFSDLLDRDVPRETLAPWRTRVYEDGEAAGGATAWHAEIGRIVSRSGSPGLPWGGSPGPSRTSSPGLPLRAGPSRLRQSRNSLDAPPPRLRARGVRFAADMDVQEGGSEEEPPG
ncbi:unnamed protein product [Pedinophyceae sp. YPF-701]|nr:unnamed protein product [Pedinophyceae sp. YPF-701]